ncbi:MAG: molybdopterin-dependent oxidoreductase [Sphingomonadaceae bacterium]
MQKVRTFCRICEPLCPMIATRDEDGAVVKLEPDREHPVSRGFACHKGLNFIQVHNDPDRINTPIRRCNDKYDLPAEFEETDWDSALADIGQKLRAIRDEHGPDAIAVYFGNPVSLNSNAFPLAATLGLQIGTRRLFNAGTQDTANKPAAVEAMFGTLNLFPVPDFAHTQYLLVFGSNPKVSHWTYTSLHRPLNVLQDINERGGKVRFINPRKIESSNDATGDVTLIRPDTDVYLMAAILNELDRQGRFDESRIARYGRNIEGLRRFVADYPPERVENVTGVPAGDIRQIAREYADSPAASVYMATGINQGRQGTLAYWLLMMMSFVTGNMGRKGGDYYAQGFNTNIRPVSDTQTEQVETSEGPVNLVSFSLPGYALGDLIAQKQNPIRALIVLSGNPLLSMPGEEKLRAGLPGLDLMVHIDLFRNATGEYADFILPAADWLERPESNLSANGFQPQPFIQSVDAVVPPRYERRDDWWIISRLQQELGIPSALDNDNADMLGRSRKILSRIGLTLEEVRAEPCQSKLLPPADPVTFFERAVMHPDGKVDCCPAQFAEAFRRCADIFAELESEDEGVFKLISLRTNYMHNTNLANMPILKRGKHALNPLHMHPDDMARLSLAKGDHVCMSNTYGSLETPVIGDESLQPGVVAMSHGYGHARAFGLSLAHAAPGANVNRLMPTGRGSFDPLSNMAHLTGVPVTLVPVAVPVASPAAENAIS